MRKSKILFSVLAMSLCFSVQPMNAKAADVTTDVTPTVTVGETSNVNQPSSVIQPFSLITGEEDLTNIPSYDIVVPLSTKSIVVPIQMDYKGQLKINLVGKVVSKGIDVTLFSDEACTTKIGYAKYLSSYSITDDMKLDIPKEATYYLKFELPSYADADATVTITPYAFSSEDKTLKEKVWVGSHPYSYDSQTSFKVTINETGYIKVEGASLADGSMYASLCNSKKEALSEQKYLYDSNKYTTYYAVKKGTYYINIKSYDDYKLRYSFTAVKDTSGQSQKKATVIGKGKTVKGVILFEDSTKKVDWYKVKLTKSQKLTLSVNAKSCDSLQFEIVPASSNVVLFGSTFSIYDEDGDIYGTKDAMPAGTYYIKVTKRDATSSGYYSIKLK
jgi:hypothetical protein